MTEDVNKCRKMANFFEYSWIFMIFFDFFEVFPEKTFEPNTTQTPAYHHKILDKIPHRTVCVRSLGSIGQKWFYIKNCPKMWFYAG